MRRKILIGVSLAVAAAATIGAVAVIRGMDLWHETFTPEWIRKPLKAPRETGDRA